MEFLPPNPRMAERESFFSLGPRRFAMAIGQAIDRGTNQLGTSRSRNERPKRHGFALACAAAGAISFWVPDVIVHADAGSNLDAKHAWAITVLAPAMFLLTLI